MLQPSCSSSRSLSPLIAPLLNHSTSLSAANVLTARESRPTLAAAPSEAWVHAGPTSDTLGFLQRLWERSPQPGHKAALIQQIGRQPGSLPLLQRLGLLRLSEEERLALIQTLATHPDPAAVAELQQLYRRHWSGSRYQQEILLALGRSQSRAGLAFLQEVYTTAWHQPAYRDTVIRALGFHGTADAIALLVQYSQQHSTDFKQQRQLIRALGYSQSAASARVLADMLPRYSRQADMRSQIYRALGATGSDTALEVLRGCLQRTQHHTERQQIQQAIAHAYGE